MSYDPSKRVGECPCEDACEMERMEISFAIPVLMTQDQQRRLLRLVDEIVSSPWNEPEEGVHWMAAIGAKPKWSQMDAAFMGIDADDDAPESGEPTFDDSIYSIETCARGFVSDKERDRVMKHRQQKESP